MTFTLKPVVVPGVTIGVSRATVGQMHTHTQAHKVKTTVILLQLVLTISYTGTDWIISDSLIGCRSNLNQNVQICNQTFQNSHLYISAADLLSCQKKQCLQDHATGSTFHKQPAWYNVLCGSTDNVTGSYQMPHLISVATLYLTHSNYSILPLIHTFKTLTSHHESWYTRGLYSACRLTCLFRSW